MNTQTTQKPPDLEFFNASLAWGYAGLLLTLVAGGLLTLLVALTTHLKSYHFDIVIGIVPFGFSAVVASLFLPKAYRRGFRQVLSLDNLTPDESRLTRKHQRRAACLGFAVGALMAAIAAILNSALDMDFFDDAVRTWAGLSWIMYMPVIHNQGHSTAASLLQKRTATPN